MSVDHIGVAENGNRPGIDVTLHGEASTVEVIAGKGGSQSSDESSSLPNIGSLCH